MSKNIMSEIIKMLGVEYGERFKLREGEVYKYGLFAIKEGEGLVAINDCGTTSLCNEELYDILSGFLEIVKLPWEPEEDDAYYYPNVSERKTICWSWSGDTMDYAFKALGMVYRTREEAEAHFKDDYKKLTGKDL